MTNIIAAVGAATSSVRKSMVLCMLLVCKDEHCLFMQFIQSYQNSRYRKYCILKPVFHWRFKICTVQVSVVLFLNTNVVSQPQLILLKMFDSSKGFCETFLSLSGLNFGQIKSRVSGKYDYFLTAASIGKTISMFSITLKSHVLQNYVILFFIK